MELKVQDTKMLQGLSVLAMLWLHLFCKEHHDIFEPIVFLGETPLSFYIAQLSDFCVMGFAFCSGYGHMVQSNKTNYYKKRLQGLIVLLMNYWVVLIVFSLVSVIAGNGSSMPGNFGRFILNFLTLDKSYNGAWWYLNTYIILVVLSPLILKIIDKYNALIILLLSFVIYCISFYIRFYTDSTCWIFGRFALFGMTLFEYMLGAIFYKCKIFSKVYDCYIKINIIWRSVGSILLVLGMLYTRTKIIPNFFVAPISGLALILLFHFWNKPTWIKKIFLFIGKHSTNMWLTHMFFYSVVFVDFVYLVKYPVLIYIFMLFITIIVSILLQLIQKPIADRLVEGN